MKSLFTLLVFVCTAYAYSLTCPNYTCSAKVVNVNEECSYEHVNKLDLHLCNSTNLVCQPIEFDAQSVCVPIVIAKNSILPGELCEKNEDCISGVCNEKANSTCTGKEENDPCKRTAECGKGLYCFNNKCNKTGSVCDEQGYGCSINQLCDRSNGTCHLIGSAAIGEVVPFSLICQSYYQDSNGICAYSVKLRNVKELDCPNKKTECVYENDYEKTEKIPCACAKTNTGKKYCGLGKGDIFAEDVSFTLSNS